MFIKKHWLLLLVAVLVVLYFMGQSQAGYSQSQAYGAGAY